MHIHPNNNLLFASLGVGREEVHEIQAKRAAEVRRKLSAVSPGIDDPDDLFSPASGVERRSYESRSRPGEDDSFGTLFSAKA